jgi:hypothetical protein
VSKRTFMLWSIALASALLALCLLTSHVDPFKYAIARLAIAWQLCNVGLYYALAPRSRSGRGKQ